MKKETISTFSGGLNYDLNPITTPNNVLTDCINGTFVTFNGDELALQNDAGNTKIAIKDNLDEYVQLSPGFYPLGMKEHGGVLYIVSGYDILKNIPNVLPNESANDIKQRLNLSIGDIVKTTDGEYKIITTFITGYTFGPILNLETELYSAERIAINCANSLYLNNPSKYPQYKYSDKRVEFGSYPSPEFAGITQTDGLNVIYDNPTKDLLYKSVVISNDIFKSGKYIKFNVINNIDSLDLSNVSYYIDADSTKPVYKFYKIKLLHQLSNGFMDLTEDIWNRYYTFKVSKQTTLSIPTTNGVPVTSITVNSTANFPDNGVLTIGGIEYIYTSKTSTTLNGLSINNTYPIGTIISPLSNHWINEKSFIYYCPNQYKGKLAISLEIEELNKFELLGVPELTLNNKQTSTITVENADNFPVSGKLIINSDTIAYTSKTGTTFSTSVPITNYYSKDSIVYYKYKTQLTENILEQDHTEINVISTEGFPTSGKITIGTDTFIYTGKTLTSFTGETQALKSHNIDDEVTITITTKLSDDIGDWYDLKFKVNAIGSGKILIPSVYATIYLGEDALEISQTNEIDQNKYIITTTKLTENIIAGNFTTINVDDTLDFPKNGSVIIGTDTFIYKSKTNTSFIGDSQTLINHSISDVVKNSVLNLNYNTTSFIFKLPKSLYQEKTITYNIIPNLQVYNINYITDDSLDIKSYEEFPVEYRNKFIINGSRLISTMTDNVKFRLEDGICKLETGIKEYSTIVLVDENDNYLDYNLQTSTTKYTFKRANGAPSDDTTLGNFSVVNDYPIVIKSTNPLLIYDDSIIQLVQNTLINVPDISCQFKNFVIYTNIPIDPANLRVTQKGEVLYPKEPGVGTSFTYTVIPDVDFLIIGDKTGYLSINLISNSQLHSTVLKFVANVRIRSEANTNKITVSWSPELKIPNVSNITFYIKEYPNKLIDSGEIVWNDKFGYTGDITIYSNEKIVYVTFSREPLPEQIVIVQGITFAPSYELLL